jgi:hypothetical protein
MSEAEVEAAIIAKAQADTSFRQALVQDPKAAIEKEFGVTLPASTESKIVEHVTSMNPITHDGELTAGELEGVAAGFLGGLIKKAGKGVGKPVIK